MRFKSEWLSNRYVLFGAAAVAAVVAATVSLAQPAQDGGPRSNDKVTVIQRASVAAQADKEERRWESRDERLRAKPLDWREAVGKSPLAAGPERPPDLQPGVAEGNLPDPKADDIARQAFPEEWKYMPQGKRSELDRKRWKGNVQLAGTADVYTQYCPSCSPNPEKAIGKVFFGGSYCSASVIGRNSIVTAAHCCWNRGANTWYGGWSFVPGYNNGAAPYGVWTWSSAAILTSFTTSFSRRADVCVINLKPKKILSFNFPVSLFVGSLGRSWDQPVLQDEHILGYPGNIGSGQVLELCTAETFSPSAACGGTDVHNAGCSMTYGSSGGPWLRFYRSMNFVNSVVSGYDNATCTGTFGQTMNSGRFTSGNIVPLCTAMGC